ncbi:hypothetical protein [Glaciihabitans sp. UYNi722]|uniref:hypothetical protein n=1 Tax=Glaciihabitans sp. UYNi722 TaxID=3156344 RepID=UPI00339A61A3
MKLLVPVIGSLVALLLSGCAATSAAPTPVPTGYGTLPAPASAWPSAQYDARHSSGTPAVGPQTGTVRWRASLAAPSCPAR